MEKEIRNILVTKVAAVKSRDVEKATSAYSEDVICFDVVGPLQFIGVKGVQKRLREWLSTLNEIVDFEVTDVKITASNNTAFSTSLNHINAKTITGDKLDMFWRETICYTRIYDEVKITHSHSSVPFDAESGQASTGLKP